MGGCRGGWPCGRAGEYGVVRTGAELGGVDAVEHGGECSKGGRVFLLLFF